MLFCIVTFNLWLHYNKLLTYLHVVVYSHLDKWHMASSGRYQYRELYRVSRVPSTHKVC